MSTRESATPDSARICYRIGINLGDIIVDADEIFGNGVNIAARLESLAQPGDICISDVVYQSIESKLDLAFDDLSAQTVKNIARSVHD